MQIPQLGENGEFSPIRFRRFRRYFVISDNLLVTCHGESWQKQAFAIDDIDDIDDKFAICD